MDFPTSYKRGQTVVAHLSNKEKERLDKLYVEDGAWTPVEANEAFGIKRIKELLAKKVIGRMDTAIGPLVLLLRQGRYELYGTADKSVSLWSQLDRAYMRLSLDELGWTRLNPATSEHKLSQYDSTGNFVEVMGPEGEALAYGRLQGGGLASKSVQRIVDRMRSQALLHNFQVFLLTPHETKGKSRAEKYDSFLHVLTVNPVDERFTHVQRVKFTDPTEGTADTGPIIIPSTSYGKRLQEELQHLPAASLETLTLPLKERRERALAALECDEVLSDAQLSKHFGLTIHDLGKVPYVRTIVRPKFNSNALEEQVEFACISRSIARLDDFKLGHRAGTAEMRLNLGVSAGKHWEAEARGAMRYEEPDAVWHSPEGEVAIEYDTGSYGMPIILRKLDAFSDRGFQRVIWGLNSRTRKDNLTKKLGDRVVDF